MMWFIGFEVEQETSAPHPKKNPGSAPACDKHSSTFCTGFCCRVCNNETSPVNRTTPLVES